MRLYYLALLYAHRRSVPSSPTDSPEEPRRRIKATIDRIEKRRCPVEGVGMLVRRMAVVGACPAITSVRLLQIDAGLSVYFCGETAGWFIDS
jgi:hypothetical protein